MVFEKFSSVIKLPGVFDPHRQLLFDEMIASQELTSCETPAIKKVLR